MGETEWTYPKCGKHYGGGFDASINIRNGGLRLVKNKI